ncbi:MAG: pyridoxal phosphate-dependent aminotransferase [SAR202 cluster bacterium]|nr:pyridoxal phosphate-dependent aminotransferase [SAR202 cluster bacterium]
MRLASRMSLLGTETAFEALARAKALEAEGRDIIFLGIGEPDFDTPAHIVESAKIALDTGYTHYVPSAGITEVRKAVAFDAGRRYNREIPFENIIITPGGKPIMFFTILSLIEEGDEVLYPNPGFPIYESMIRFAGGTPIPMQLHERLGYNPDLKELENQITSKTKLIIVNSPNNPCGSVIPRTDLQKISTLAKDADAIVLADEIYKDFYYEGTHSSITEFPDMWERTIILDGLSKSYAMTGWRIGFGIFPDFLVEPITRLVTNSVSCTAAFSQIASVSALESSQQPVWDMVAEFKKRRDLLVDGLNNIPGIKCPMPEGAFYAFPNITGTGYSSEEFERNVLTQTGISLLSGTSFGKFGEGYVRISFANSQDNIREALKRLREFLSN